MKCTVIKGGWFWKGEEQLKGAVIDGQTDQWIGHRVRDGLVVAGEVELETEAAEAPATDNAEAPRARGRK